MKKVMALLMAIVFSILLVGCGEEKNAQTTAQNVLPAANDETLTLKTEISMKYIGSSMIFEHYYNAKGQLVKTDARSMDYMGLVVSKYEYTYDNDVLKSMAEYHVQELDLDNKDAGQFTFDTKLFRTVEFSKNSDGSLIGKDTYRTDSFGEDRIINNTATITYNNASLSNVQYNGINIDYDEKGKKISETDGKYSAKFTYDGDFVTEMQLYEGETLKYTYTVEYDQNGYVKTFTRLDDEGENDVYTCEIDATTHLPLKSNYRENTYVYEYTDKGYIKCIEATGKGYVKMNVTYDDNSRVTNVLYEGTNVDGYDEMRKEWKYTYGSNGKKTELLIVEYYSNDSGVLEKDDEIKYTYLYDTNGNLVEEKVQSEDEYLLFNKIISYDKNGLILSNESTEAGKENTDRTRYEYEYYANGQRKKETRTDYYENSDKTTGETIQTTEYDEQGYELKDTEKRYENGILKSDTHSTYTHTHEYKYGKETKRVTENIIYDADNNPIKKVITTYKYEITWNSSQRDEYKYENGTWV